MFNDTKMDIINGAYSQLRISGITVEPSTDDTALALSRLENLMRELAGRSVDLAYNFEDTPLIGSLSGVDAAVYHSLECLLALRLVPDFVKGFNLDPILAVSAQNGASFLYAFTAAPIQTTHGNRQPIGSGNIRFSRYRRFYRTVTQEESE